MAFISKIKKCQVVEKQAEALRQALTYQENGRTVASIIFDKNGPHRGSPVLRAELVSDYKAFVNWIKDITQENTWFSDELLDVSDKNEEGT